MRFLRRSLVGIFLLSLTLGLLAWAGNTVRGAVETRMNQEPRSFPQRERLFAVNVVTVERQTIAPELTVFGELRSTRTLDLRAVVGGRVLETAPSLVEGGEVAAGDLLLRIDPATAQSARDRVAADLQDAEAELRDSERSLIFAQEELDAARAQAELRAQALARASDLKQRGVGTTAAVETAELAASSADAAVLARRQALASVEARDDQARTRLARAKINLADAERALEDTEVWAEFDGTLSDVTIAPGGRITNNERFATLLDPSQLEVSFRLSTSQYARLLDESGQLIKAPVSVGLDVSGVNLQTSGEIIRESAAVGAGQTGRLLFAKLDAAPGLRPGDFVTVSITEPELRGVALVPATAVASDETVLVVGEGDRLELAETQILRRQGDNVLIQVRGLGGKQIVAERSPLLGAGIGVKPIQPDAEIGAPPPPPEMVALEPERRAKLLAFVEESRMPADVKNRIKAQLEEPEVPSNVIARLESRMGG